MTPKWWPRVPKGCAKWRVLDAQLVSMYRSGAHPNGTFDTWEQVPGPGKRLIKLIHKTLRGFWRFIVLVTNRVVVRDLEV